MIVLIQLRYVKTDQWGDMKIPARKLGIPVRGKPPLITTVEQLSDELKHAELEGEYRVFLHNGEMWRVKVVRREVYEAEISLDKPLV